MIGSRSQRRRLRAALRLAARLRTQKAAAEAADRAKTRFLAAASHDLRQPLHALGLFAKALRERSHADPQLTRLAGDIGESVEALDALFSELLDITRIDAGGVEPRAEPFRVGALFRRLELHFGPSAFDKGLRLAFRGAMHHAHADPLLVDRILRNLISNAIRYTEDGGVLVACRRRGERLWLQVWDSGIGIEPGEQERIFEEFYRASDERKGLGLGLAIVRRLAALMDAPLALRSQPGRGSVFTLELPAGRAVPRAPLELTLDGRRFVVVESRAALRSLLEGWGASVLGFETAAACAAWAREAPAGKPPPELVLVDRDDAGMAISALRERFGRGLPAIVVAADASAAEAANEIHRLARPVAPNKLRALIGFKLGLH